MRKSFISMLLLSVLCFSLFAFAGCDNSVTITDLEGYSDMQTKADRIEVKFDNGTGKPFRFNITDEANLRAIMGILLNEALTDIGNGALPPGDNTSITVFQGEKSYVLSVRNIQSNDTVYAFSTMSLQTKIVEIATAKGAYDTKIGVVYKVIDLSDIDNVKQIAATASDKTELSALIATSFDDEWKYLYVYEENETDSTLMSRGLDDSSNRVYFDRVTLTQNKLLVVYEIYKNFSATPYYYIASPSKSQFVNTGNVKSTEYVLGLYNPCKLIISIAS